VNHGTYGVSGSGVGLGTSALNAYAPGYQFLGNVLIGPTPSSAYPSQNDFAPTLLDVGFVNPSQDDYRLAQSSPYLAFMGTTPGADVGGIANRTTGVIQ
jgi:hypothetical protein